MGKSVLAFVVTILAGCIGLAVGYERFGGTVEFGSITAIAVMGAFIIYYNEKRNNSNSEIKGETDDAN